MTTTYKKANKNIGTKINKEGIKFAKQADILDKNEINGTGNTFVTLKDHKENFTNHPTTRLINTSKNEIGRISNPADTDVFKTSSRRLKKVTTSCNQTRRRHDVFRPIQMSSRRLAEDV